MPMCEPCETHTDCPNCNKIGVSRSIITPIPHFQTVSVNSFRCDHCDFFVRNVEIFSDYKPHGTIVTLNGSSIDDLSRLVVWSENCKVSFPDVSLNIPPQKDNNVLNTIEGFITEFSGDLVIMQTKRREEDPDFANEIDIILSYFENVLKTGVFKIILNDPSGNSYIELLQDGVTVEKYTRTDEDNTILGLKEFYDVKDDERQRECSELNEKACEEDDLQVNKLTDICESCRAECEMNCHLVDVPHFDKVIMMTTVCWRCGHKSCQLKSGQSYQSYGVRWEMKIRSVDDLMKDVILIDSTIIKIPELEFESSSGVGLDSTYTTVEGLLMGLRNLIVSTTSVFAVGDSGEERERVNKLVNSIDEICNNTFGEVTLILDDITGNCRILVNDEDNVISTQYKRTREQDLQLGL